MKITINALGSRGDVQPYVALGKGLVKAGHDVLFATHQLFEELVREHRLELFPIAYDPRDVLLSKAVSDIGGNPIRVNRWLVDNYKPLAKEIFRFTLLAARDADLILNSALSIAGYHVAEKLGIMAMGIYLQPVTPTRAFANFSPNPLPGWIPFKEQFNYYTTKITNQLFFNMTRKIVNECRAEILDLPSLSMSYYWRVDSPSWSIPLLYGFSPSIIPPPADWGPNQKICGYWFLDGDDPYAPPEDLLKFMESGPAPVSVGFGSMVDHQSESLTQLVVEALDKVDKRAVLLGGWSELGDYRLPDSILPIDFAPHEWLFPRMSAAVHHGGAGTTAAALRAGTPSVVIPFFADQPFWGKRVFELGAGPKPIPRKKLSAAGLAGAIESAVGDENIQRRARELGICLRAEDGVGTAVQLIEQFADQ